MKKTHIDDNNILKICALLGDDPTGLMSMWDRVAEELSPKSLSLLTNFFVINGWDKAAKYAIKHAPMDVLTDNNYNLLAEAVFGNHLTILKALFARKIDFKSIPKDVFVTCDTKHHAAMAGFLVERVNLPLDTYHFLIPSYIEYKGGSVMTALQSRPETERPFFLEYMNKSGLRISEYDPDYDHENPLIR